MVTYRKKIFLRIFQAGAKYWLWFLGAFICIGVSSAVSLVLPVLAGYVFKVIEQKNLGAITGAALYGVGLYFIQGWASYGQLYLLHYVGQRLVADLRNNLFEHLQDLSLDFFSNWRSGEIVSRFINDLSTLQNSLVSALGEMLPRLVIFVGLFGYIIFLNWRLTLVTVITLPFFVYVLANFSTEMQKATREIQKKVADLASILQETLSGIRVVKSFALEKETLKKFTLASEKNFYFSMKISQVYATQGPVMTFLQILGTIFIIWYGGLEVVQGRLTTPALISFLVAIGILADPILVLSRSYTLLQQARVSAERIFEVVDLKPTVAEPQEPVVLEKIQGHVAFKNVSFYYPGQKIPALKNIDLEVKPGEIIALVGPSGAGKSTLVNLIPRFYDPGEGEILIDGVEVQKMSLKFLRAHLGIVPQETVLFSGTILSNIAYGKLDASVEEIKEAAQKAKVHEFIENLPAGYETEVGERGLLLSGGERQRLAIARAILKNPQILILDEATSSLDSHSENLIQEAVWQLMKDRTTFVIAHRLLTVQNARRIVVLDQGKIIATGPHAELLEKSALYKNLYERQFR